VYHASAGDDVRIVLDREESKHLIQVLRCRVGDAVGVFDGKGGEWHARVASIETRAVQLARGEPMQTVVEAPVVVRLYQGLCRGERMEWVVQKATEVGAVSIHPVPTARAETRPPDAKRLERWRRIAREACKQCGRRVLPIVEPVPALPEIPGRGVLPLLLDPAPGCRPLGEILAGADSPPAEVWLAVGPEGGFDPRETADLGERGWQATSLGPRTLRTETAGLLALALTLHRLGDLGPAGVPPAAV
jgi:16S rRNA (uracil1498-N3)-methyltransferase